jgi:aminopeptidase N
MIANSYVTYNGRQFFKAVLPNFDDRTLIKIEMDEHSLKFFKDNVTRIKDEISKSMIWYAFFEMVKDAKMTMDEFLSIIQKNIVNEYKDDIVGDILLYLH